MKRAIYIILLALPAFANAMQGQNADTLFARANKHYISGNYTEALKLYEAVIGMGKESPELYFNLGNSYFKLNDIAHAILNYERAHLLAPNDEDIVFNLELARTYTVDKIDAIPDFFVVKWFKQLANAFSSNGWAILAITFFIVTLALLLVYQFSGRYMLKRYAFTFSWVAAFLFIISLIFSNVQKNRIANSNHAIVITSSVAVKGSPSENSSDIFILHAGTKVQILRNLGDWSEIKIADGSKGWLKKSTFEKI